MLNVGYVHFSLCTYIFVQRFLCLPVLKIYFYLSTVASKCEIYIFVHTLLLPRARARVSIHSVSVCLCVLSHLFVRFNFIVLVLLQILFLFVCSCAPIACLLKGFSFPLHSRFLLASHYSPFMLHNNFYFCCSEAKQQKRRTLSHTTAHMHATVHRIFTFYSVSLFPCLSCCRVYVFFCCLHLLCFPIYLRSREMNVPTIGVAAFGVL